MFNENIFKVKQNSIFVIKQIQDLCNYTNYTQNNVLKRI